MYIQHTYMQRALFLGLLVSSIACGRSQPDATPEGAVRIWLEKMEDSAEDPRASKEAFELLSGTTRKNLEARALRDGPRHGRRIAPEEMLATGRFGLRFRPKHFSAQLSGDRAVVLVRGDESSEQASIPCVRELTKEKEDKRPAWRLDLELSELPPQERSERRP
jgi:hypothetical protein